MTPTITNSFIGTFPTAKGKTAKMTTKRTFARRLAAGTSAAALALVGVAGVAFADPVGDVGPDQPDHPEKGSLIIHKLVGAQGDAGDGTEIATAPGDPLDGVEFTYWQLGVEDGDDCVALDLEDPEAWESVPTGKAPATLDEVEATFCIVGSDDGITGDVDEGSGVVTFDELPLGLYYVQETDAPDEVISKSAPFYVTIPLPHADGSWIYDVNVYPKNRIADVPEKVINEDADQGGLHIGSTVEWTITQEVPALNEGQEFESASLWDYLPAGVLEYADTTSVTLLVDGGDDIELTEDTDYEIASGVVSWTFTEDGLAQLEAGQTIEVVFTTKVLQITESGEIANPGSDGPEKPGYGSEFNGAKKPGEPTPYTYWGALKVTKVAEVDGEDVGLEGAIFEIYPQIGAACDEEAPADGLVSTGTSGTDGVVNWTPDNGSPLGLFVGNSNDGPLEDPSKVYCLYETKAPAGYTGVVVQTVTISAGNTLKADVNDLSILNTPKDGPELPLTGAQGTLIMSIGGLLLVALGAGVYTLSQRKKAQNA